MDRNVVRKRLAGHMTPGERLYSLEFFVGVGEGEGLGAGVGWTDGVVTVSFVGGFLLGTSFDVDGLLSQAANGSVRARAARAFSANRERKVMADS
jgi:hypothetical protein